MRICRTYSDLCSCNFIYDKLNSIEIIVKVYVILDHPSYMGLFMGRETTTRKQANHVFKGGRALSPFFGPPSEAKI